jgi:hypothetical protein
LHRFRTLASLQKLGCNAELIVDEFGEKLLEELDYTLVSILVPFYFFCQFLCIFNIRQINFVSATNYLCGIF